MTQPVRWGFVGASTIAREHMIAAVRASGHDVVAITSGSAERARAYAHEHGIARAHESLESLLADPAVEAVYISSTNEKHCAQVLAAAAAGKHVLCEKPLALTVADARRMVNACGAAGVVMGTNHHLRNAATHRALRDLVQQGAIGQPLFARIHHAVYLRPVVHGWRIHDSQAGGGVILDIAVHDVDALRFVLAQEPEQAVAMTQSAYLASDGLEDGAMAVLRMSGGVLAHVHAAYTTRSAVTGFEILGDQGSLEGREVMGTQPVGTVTLRNADGVREVPLAHESLYARGVAAFSDAVRGRGAPTASGDDGVRSLAAALAIARSAKSGAAESIPR